MIGSGANVERELVMVDRADFDVVLGVNRAAMLYGPVDYHVSLHPEQYAPVKVAPLVAHRKARHVDIVHDCLWRRGGNSGSSGLFAVKFALERLGASCVTLAGVGMDYAPHVYNALDWPQAEMFQRTWREVAPQLRGNVVSLGGWTAELLSEDHDGTGN